MMLGGGPSREVSTMTQEPNALVHDEAEPPDPAVEKVAPPAPRATPTPRRRTSRRRPSRGTRSPAPPKGARPNHSLPTNRVAFGKQLDLLRMFAVTSGPSEKGVRQTEIAKIIDLHPSTIQLVTPFLTDTHLLRRTEGGFVPAPEVFAFTQAHAWNPTTAPRKLGPVLGATWFAQALLPQVAYRALAEAQAISILAEAAAAGPEYKNQLAILLDYLAAGGLISREGGMVRPLQPGAIAEPETPAEAVPSGERKEPMRAAVATAFTKDLAEGIVQFNVSVRVNMAEFSTWPSDRIQAFFGGIAQVLAAKSGIEEEEGGPA
jgi:hypothetical protein